MIKRTVLPLFTSKLLATNRPALNQLSKRELNLAPFTSKLLSSDNRLYRNVKRNVNLVPIGRFLRFLSPT